MKAQVFVCGVKPAPTVECSQCHDQFDEAKLLACKFELRGDKAGQTCPKRICKRCSVEVGGKRYCPPHGNVKRKVG